MRKSGGSSEVAIGYAAGPTGSGVAYASLGRAGGDDVLRLPFRIAGLCARVERAASYAALAAVAQALHKRGVARVRFVLPDEEFVDEVTSRGEVPEHLVMPYVRLRCALNAFAMYEIISGATDDLTQRARAEVALNQAA